MAQEKYLTDQSLLAENPEAIDLSRQRRLAEMLTLQGFQQPQGAMVSGQYVKPSWTQQIAPLASAIAGQSMNKRLDERQMALAEALRNKQEKDITKFGELMQTSPNEAYQFASKSNIPQLREIGLKKMMPEEFTLSEGQKRIITMPDGTTKEIAAGEKKYHAPTSVDMGTLGTMLIYPDGRREMVQKGREGPANQIVETPNGFVAVNPRNPTQAIPVMVGGQPLMGTKGNLPEGPTKQVTGAVNLKDAIDNYKNTLQSFSTLDMADPDARANMGNAYNNMMLQAKEAYNLGVLNGPDYQILQSVVKDPTKISSLLVSKKTLEKQANDLGTQADKIIENVYKTHNRNVPANLKPVQTSNNQPTQNQNFDPALLQYMTPEQQALFAPKR